jgi:rubrerythrin
MIAQRTLTNNRGVVSAEATVQAVVELLAEHKQEMTRRWICEVCGMVHTGSLPTACDSCGAADALIQQPDFRTQMNSRW